MSAQSTRILSTSTAGIAEAATLLRAGKLVSFPTETVYGLGADACNAQAVAAIYATKERPAFNPLIVHVRSFEHARLYGRFGDGAKALARAFWPGPLSLVVPLAEGHGLSALVTAGLDTVALRVPAHPAAQALLEAFDGPLAAPSANPSGRISPTQASHVMQGLSGKIAAVLDGGACGVGLESTIVAPGPPARLLRPGGIARRQLETVLPLAGAQPATGPITSPGQLASHYAPRARVRLNARSAKPGEVHLGFGEVRGDLSLSTAGDLAEAAANLFSHLHRLDADGRPIAVAPIPEDGLGIAINDRLRRAAAPRYSMPPKT